MTLPLRIPDTHRERQDRQAQLLASLLRRSRLTVVCGEAGDDKHSLLRSNVLPSLHRRAEDRASPGATPGVVLAFPDRRRFGAGAPKRSEVVVFLDDWERAPARSLRCLVDAAVAQRPDGTPARASRQPGSDTLAGLLVAHTERFPVRFLFVFDRFEDCLAAATAAGSEASDLLDQLAETINRHDLPAHFLIAIEEAAQPLLEDFGRRIDGFDPRGLQLPDDPDAWMRPAPLRAAPVGAPLPRAAAVADARAGPEPPSMPSDLTAGPGPAPTVPDAVAAAPTHAALLYDSIIGARWGLSPAARGADASRPPSKDAAAERTLPPPIASAPIRPDPVAPGVPARPAALAAPDDADAPLPESPTFAEPAAPRPPAPQAPPLLTDAVREDFVETKPAVFIDFSPLGMHDGAAGLPLPGDGIEPPFGEPPPLPRLQRPAPRFSPIAMTAVALCGVAAGLAYLLLHSQRSAIEEQTLAQALSQRTARPTETQALPVAAGIAAATPARPRVELLVDPAEAALAGELMRRVAPAAGFEPALRTPEGWAEGLRSLREADAARFAIARYDALQAARRGPEAGLLQIVAPLYTEEVYFVVRADSPLTYIHEIEGHLIDAGAEGSARALTVGSIHERLFGRPLPPRPATMAEGAAALRGLGDRSTDVIALVAPEPPAWLAAGLRDPSSRALKLLRLDGDHPASRRALQAFLPAQAPPVDAADRSAQTTPTLAVMSFLVAGTAPDGASAAAIGPLARALCEALPALQRDGHAKWREVQPAQQLPAGWPYSTAAASAFGGCERAAASSSPNVPKGVHS